MEDIDKNGDGKIDLSEYIGKWISSAVSVTLNFSQRAFAVLHRGHVHSRQWGK